MAIVAACLLRESNGAMSVKQIVLDTALPEADVLAAGGAWRDLGQLFFLHDAVHGTHTHTHTHTHARLMT